MISVKDILGAMKKPSRDDVKLIRHAYSFAKKIHEGRKRYSGEPCFTHSTAVAKQLAEMELDAHTITASLLCGVIEYTDTTRQTIEDNFGKEVQLLVSCVTKLGEHKYRGTKRHAESLRRLMVATSTDIRALLIKLMDRYNNMVTLESAPEKERLSTAIETVEIYAPIADRLGMGRLKRDLEDLSFPYIDPDAYQHTLEVRKLKSKETDRGLIRAQKTLRRELVRKGFTDFHTSIRIKGLWSLHQKLKRKHDDITLIHDVAALRIIVSEIDDCYLVLGVIHALWKPLPGNFKDYIASPKPNGYQSLHTTVITRDAGVVEIQVRTEKMHRHAQFGIASHMSYKTLGKDTAKASSERFSLAWVRTLIPSLLRISKKNNSSVMSQTTEKVPDTALMPHWLSELADAHTSAAGTNEFITGLKEDFFSYRVFVFTPKGDAVDLPINSTPIDFAYAIHSDIGNHMQGAKVNGKLASFDSPLVNGDVVDIITRQSAHPTTKWLDYARTTLARRNIRTVLVEKDTSVPSNKKCSKSQSENVTTKKSRAKRQKK